MKKIITCEEAQKLSTEIRDKEVLIPEVEKIISKIGEEIRGAIKSSGGKATILSTRVLASGTIVGQVKKHLKSLGYKVKKHKTSYGAGYGAGYDIEYDLEISWE